MDPTACFNRIMAAFDDGEYHEVAYQCKDLDRWLLRGGAMPKLDKHDWTALTAHLAELALRNIADGD